MKITTCILCSIFLTLAASSAFANAFLYSDGAFTEIKTSDSRFNNDSAFGINTSGQIVGEYGVPPLGYLYYGGTVTPIIYPGSLSGTAQGINESGQIVGGSPTHGYLDSNGTFSSIDYPNARFTSPEGINDSGQIVGYYEDSYFRPHGFLYIGGAFSSMNYPGSDATNVTGINNPGDMVGLLQFPGSLIVQSFLYHQGAFTFISYPGAQQTYAFGINDSGQIVGYYTNGHSGSAFVETAGKFSSITNPGSGWTDMVAYGINDNGQIVGEFSPSPEPTNIALLGTGVLGLAGVIRRKLML